MSDDDEPDLMSIEGLDARLVNVETILPDLFDMYELRAAGGPYYGRHLNTTKPSSSGTNSANSSPDSTDATSPTWPIPATGSRAAGTDTHRRRRTHRPDGRAPRGLRHPVGQGILCPR